MTQLATDKSLGFVMDDETDGFPSHLATPWLFISTELEEKFVIPSSPREPQDPQGPIQA